MRNILIIGAGRSATSLIRYLLDKSEAEDLFITIGDISVQNAKDLHTIIQMAVGPSWMSLTNHNAGKLYKIVI